MLVNEQKKILRTQMLKKREQWKKSTSTSISQDLLESLKQHIPKKINPLVEDSAMYSQIVAGYMPIGSEINPLPLLVAIMQQGANIAMPIVIAKDTPLIFRPYTADCEMVKGSLGTSHPKNGEPVEPRIIFVPLLAFDKEGFRLGYGGGFYDRTLALLPNAVSIGLAFDEQYSETPLPRDKFDIPLTGVLTPSRYYSFEPTPIPSYL